MKHIVITGAGGFLGGHLAHYFVSQGHQVTAVFHRQYHEHFEQVAKRQTQKNELQARIIPEQQARLSCFDADITDRNDMELLFAQSSIDTLIHTAAQLIAPQQNNYSNTDAYTQAMARFNEVNQGKVLADCAAQYQLKHKLYCLLVSTAFVFDAQATVINENTPFVTANPYAQSKIEAQHYWERKLSNFAVIYPPQIYGPYQFTPAIMPKLIRKMLFDEGPSLRISGIINPIHVTHLSQLIYSLCLAQAQSTFCVNGDGPTSLEYIAQELQQAAQNLLQTHQQTAYPAFELVPSSTPTQILSINDTKLINHYNVHRPHDNPHQAIEFSHTAKEMVKSHWRHAQKTNLLMGLDFFGMRFKDCFTKEDLFTDDLRKTTSTANPTVIPQINLVCVLSGRSTVLNDDADGLKREFDRSDDLARMYEGVRIAREICALRAGKKVTDLTPDDCVIPIFYNGRALHNKHLKEALKRGLFNYPSSQFIIRDIYPDNTIGQIQCLRRFLAEYMNKGTECIIAIVSSTYHEARVNRTVGYNSPQASNDFAHFIKSTHLPEHATRHQNTYFLIQSTGGPQLYYNGYNHTKPLLVPINNMSKFEAELAKIPATKESNCRLTYEEVVSLIMLNGGHTPQTNPLSKPQFLLFGAHKNEKRCGIKLDIRGEHDAMVKYSSGTHPSISRYSNPNVFFTDFDLAVRKSMNAALRCPVMSLRENKRKDKKNGLELIFRF